METMAHQLFDWLCCADCSFKHDQEPLEVSEVLFAWDEKRSGDVVFAAGWNAKVSAPSPLTRKQTYTYLA